MKGKNFANKLYPVSKTDNDISNVEQYREYLFNSQQEMIFVMDMEENITNVNKTALDFMGYEEKELLGKHIGIIFAPEFREKSVKIGPRKVLTGEIPLNLPLYVISKKGEKTLINFNGSP
ncbi:MAG: PAS domain S-box protein, partial [Thermodesulfobacteriota bacterium]|nr:PAS domain S-box protein [Thermodesulfobacteriota bacterium]